MGLFSFFKKSSKKPVSKATTKSSAANEKQVGVITHYFGKISVGIIKLKSKLQIGDKIHIKGAHDDFKQTIKSMQINNEDVDSGKKGDEVGIKVKKKVHENDIVYKIAN